MNVLHRLSVSHPAVEGVYTLSDMPMPMVVAEHRMMLDCNEVFASQFGYLRRELVNRSFSILYPSNEDFVRTGRLWRAHLASGRVYIDERIMRRKDGSLLWCHVHGRSTTPNEPFARAVYCFEAMDRRVAPLERVLTPRQRQILMLIARGLSSEDIGGELGLSRRTVEAHRARLMKAVGVRNGAELMVWFSERQAG